MDSFLNHIKYFLRKPVSDDPEMARDAQMLWIMIISLNVIGILVMASSLAFRSAEDLMITGGFTATVFLLSVYLLHLIHKERHIRAGHIFSTFFSALFFINALLFNGIRDVNITIYFLLVLMAGLVLGKKGLAIYGTVAILSATLLYGLEKRGFLEAQFSPSPQAEDLIILNFVLMCACLLIFAALNNTDQGYKLLIGALEQLKQTTVSKEYADNLIASMEDMLFVIDQSMSIQTINRSVISKLGYTEPELVGQPFHTVFVPESTPLWLHSGQERSLISSIIKQSDHKIVSKDGQIMNISLSASLIKITGDRSGVICIAHDISQQKEVERALVEARNEAVEFATAKSNFLTNISHELRTPLNAVIGLSTLLNSTELDEEQQEYSEQISESSEELLSILENLLDYSNGDGMYIELEEQPTYLGSALNETLSAVSQRAQAAGLTYLQTIDIPTDMPYCIDGEKLSRTLTIFADNAIKFTKEGSVEIFVKGVPSINQSLAVWFVISDTGIGIPEDQLDKIFDPFVQVDGSYTRQKEGTGIGLALAQQIVQRMGGEILVQSELGVGSTFSFSIEIKPALSKVPQQSSYV